MKFLGEIIKFLDYKIETPTPYGAFHIVFLIWIVLMTVFLCVRYKNADERIYKRIVLIAFIVMALFELYKQFNYTFSYDGEKINADYQWYAFPYQFCSTPLYVFPIIAFCKNKKVYDFAISYIMTFVLFAGIAVMLYPNTIYISTLLINVQTSVHHGLQVVIGIFTICYYRKRIVGYSMYFKGLAVFTIASIIAIILNLLAPLITTETFNMFFISPYFECTIPILSNIQPYVIYPVFLILYLIGFAIVSFIVFEASKLTLYLIKRYSK